MYIKTSKEDLIKLAYKRPSNCAIYKNRNKEKKTKELLIIIHE